MLRGNLAVLSEVQVSVFFLFASETGCIHPCVQHDMSSRMAIGGVRNKFTAQCP